MSFRRRSTWRLGVGAFCWNFQVSLKLWVLSSCFRELNSVQLLKDHSGVQGVRVYGVYQGFGTKTLGLKGSEGLPQTLNSEP